MTVVLSLGVIHFFLLFLAYGIAKKRGRDISKGEFIFCLMIPLFGAACALAMACSKDPDPKLLDDMIKKQDPIRKYYTAVSHEAASTAPMEEALLINDPPVRREMMMKLLRDDPGNNIELLMIARFNDDPETAHYATASLTEYQRRTEIALQQSQALLAKQPDNTEERLRYIKQLETYIDTGLLEGHLLRRQQLLMEKELEKIPEPDISLEIGCLKVKNLLAINKTTDALETAQLMIRKFPGEEAPWLELMRVMISSGDKKGLAELKKQIETAEIFWSFKGRETADYFLKGIQ